jgi:hypothetical protein
MSLAVFDVEVHEVRDLLLQVAGELKRIRQAQERIAWATVRPAGFSGISINNVVENGMAVSNISLGILPAPSPAETASQRLEVHVAGFVSLTQTLPVAGGTALFAVSPGSEVTCELACLDAAGNVSAEASLVFSALDNTAPPAPEGFGAVTINDTDTALPGFEELVPVV